MIEIVRVARECEWKDGQWVLVEGSPWNDDLFPWEEEVQPLSGQPLETLARLLLDGLNAEPRPETAAVLKDALYWYLQRTET